VSEQPIITNPHLYDEACNRRDPRHVLLLERRMAAREEQLKAWMIAGLEGDAAAQTALLSALVPMLRDFYRRRIAGGGEDIEDLIQETLISVHTRRSTYDRDRPVTAWLYAIARHRLIDYVRARKQVVPLEAVLSNLAADRFEDAATASADLDRVLAMLPTKQARAIRQTRVEGLSVPEAATVSGLGESDVKVSVHRGLKTLAARILRS
jgi:RNA polymerase sigma factor (sigma-70 family)